jgi:hypothetical protein
MRVARPVQGRVAGLKAPRYINIENALVDRICESSTNAPRLRLRSFGRDAERPVVDPEEMPLGLRFGAHVLDPRSRTLTREGDRYRCRNSRSSC